MRDYDWYEKVSRESIEKRKKELQDKKKNHKREDIDGSYDDSGGSRGVGWADFNDDAALLYIVVMVGAIIFKDRWLIWINATLIYYLHMTRHKRK